MIPHVSVAANFVMCFTLLYMSLSDCPSVDRPYSTVVKRNHRAICDTSSCLAYRFLGPIGTK